MGQRCGEGGARRFVQRERAAFRLTLALLAAGACACESAPKSSGPQAPVGGDTPSTSKAAPEPPPPEPPPPQPLPAVPASTQEPAVLELAQRIVALGQGPLGTFAEVSAQLQLPNRGLLGQVSDGKQRSYEIGSAKLTLSMRNGTWEPPLGNSGYFPREPMVESIELRGPGSLGLAHGEGASVVTTLPFDAPGVVVRWPGYFYLSETQNAADQDSARWYLGRFLGRAPFDYGEQERRDTEAALIAISRELEKGQRDLPAYMAKHYASLRHPRPQRLGYLPQETRDPSDAQEPATAPQPVVYDFGAALMLVEPQSLSVRFVGPMKMPEFFAAHGVQDIQTMFVHDVGQRVITIERPGLAIVPNDYFFGDVRRQRSPEMGRAAEAKLLELLIVGK